jgi:hypothetical protein
MIETCRFEYSRDLLNSNCDFGFIGVVPKQCSDEIRSRILTALANESTDAWIYRNTKEIIYDIINDRNRRQIFPNIRFDVELSWKYAMDMIVKDLKKTFIDSNVYHKNKEIYDIHDKVTIHRFIIVDWN